MRARDDEVSHKVALARGESDYALASAALCLVRVGRHSLDIAKVRQRDRDVLFIDKSLFIEFSFVGHDLGAARVAPLVLDLQKLGLDDAHQLVLVGEQTLVVRDLLEELIVLGLDLLALEALQLGEPHIEYRLRLDL